jgi:hypothetical protein
MTSENTDSEADSVYCPSCAEEIPPTATFCPECGTEINPDNVQKSDTGYKPLSVLPPRINKLLKRGKEGEFEPLFPGIDEEYTDRRNFLVSILYLVAIVVPTSAVASQATVTLLQDENSAAESGGESYPSAFYYDSSTGIVIEDNITDELGPIGSLYIRGTARNESGQNYDYVGITWDVLDRSGAKITDAIANVSGLDDGQRWRYEALAVSADNADSYSLGEITAY